MKMIVSLKMQMIEPVLSFMRDTLRTCSVLVSHMPTFLKVPPWSLLPPKGFVLPKFMLGSQPVPKAVVMGGNL